MEPEQVRNIMDSMIRKLYDMELEEQGRSDWQNGSIAEEGKRYLKEHFLLDISEYDVIIGYRADDSYFSFAQDFVAGVISLQKLSEAMQLGELGEQIVLKSPQAFEKIKYVKDDCLLVDLASNPGGIDKKAAKDKNLKLIWALALPGKVAPITTAEFIKDTVYNILKEIYKK